MTAARDAFRAEVFIRDTLNPISRQFAATGGRLREVVPNLAAAAEGDAELLPVDAAQSRAALWSVLALEAVFWLRWGVDDGSLPGDIVDMASERDAFWPTVGEMADGYAEALTLDADVHAEASSLRGIDFFEALVVSREALTPEHIEFLRLVHFASDAEWRVRLSELEMLASNAGRFGSGGLSSGVVDRLSWALSGRPEDGFAFFPSSWRFWWIREPTHSALRRRSGSRWDGLAIAVTDLPALLQPLWFVAGEDGESRLKERSPLAVDFNLPFWANNLDTGLSE